MKKIFIAGIIWEIVRFTILYLTAALKINSDLMLFLISQQFVLLYIYFFLILDTEKYCQYIKILAAGKFLSLFTGILFLVKTLFKEDFTVVDILYPANMVFVDGIFFIVFVYILTKSSKELGEAEE